jgi:hypothetical protein
MFKDTLRENRTSIPNFRYIESVVDGFWKLTSMPNGTLGRLEASAPDAAPGNQHQRIAPSPAQHLDFANAFSPNA